MSDLSRLTVPQLKALCKERRITGYSKLSKAALLQKLAGAVVPAQPSATVGGTTHQQTVSLATTNGTGDSATSTTEHSRAQQGASLTAASSTQQPVQQIIPPATGAAAPTEHSRPPQIPAVVTQTNTGTSTKRPAHTDISAPPKRTKTTAKPSDIVATPERPSPVFKVPELPVRPKKSLHANASTPARQPRASDTANRQIAAGPGRFKPLVVSRPVPSEEAPSVVTPKPIDSALALNAPTTPLPVLSHITLPPKASERKWVHRWAIILSALSPQDRHACTLVSRTFRYAVYLSATHILSRDFPGRRLDAIFEQYPNNMTNFWPYLQHRVAQVSGRRQAFQQSFLGRYTNAIGYDPLSKRVWTCPDDEKQVDVALRFVLTRMWFATSVGAYGHDASTWSRCVVQDVQEVVKGDVWQVVTRDDTGAPHSFYVLEATCEVIGRPPSPSQGRNQDAIGYPLRADWTGWISERSKASLDAPSRSLLECVKWSNTEEYHRGISKAWLQRVQGQGADDMAKRRVAERYVLACVVANSISGQWMSTSAMAQEFAGLPDKRGSSGRALGRAMNTMNMYLAAHHHTESIHFTTSKGEELHTAVAVVQTPGREYFVLRDNGMQVGCEEEGIPQVWQTILGCNSSGIHKL